MPILATLGKIGLAVGSALIVEHGDEIVDGVIKLFSDDPEPSEKSASMRGLDNQMASKETIEIARATGLPKLTPEQAKSASAIANVCNILAIFSSEERRLICMALWVNAWHESKLKPSAHNPRGENSKGLFQINVNAHPKWGLKKLYDPHVNTAAILILCLRQQQFLEAVSSGSLAQLVYVICRYVERPKNAHASALKRVKTARVWYGNDI